MNFTVQQENSHLRSINTGLRKRIELLESESGIDIYREKCKAEAEEMNRELNKTVKSKDIIISRQQKTIDKLSEDVTRAGQKVEQAEQKAEAFRLKAEQESAARTELQKKVNGLALAMKSKDHKIERLESENAGMKDQIGKLTIQVRELTAKTEKLEDDNGKMKKQLGTNSGNSGVPTSRERIGGKPAVPNSRTPSTRSPGAQPNHPGHGRNQSARPSAGTVRIIGENDPLWNNPDYVFESYSLKKIYTPVMVLWEDIYLVPSFRHIVTGAHKQVDCPDDLRNEVGFSPEYKATVLTATERLNLGVQKVQDLISIMTHDAFDAPSAGFISELSTEFAAKSDAEQSYIYQKELNVHTLHVDGTVVKCGKRKYNVTIATSGKFTMYFFRPIKGRAGVKGTPIEKTTAVLVHDHDPVYYSFGKGHQECLEHVLRYLTGSIEQEVNLSWAIEAKELLQKMIHASKEADRVWAEKHPDEAPHLESDDFSEDDTMTVNPRFSEEVIAEYKRELLEITQKGLEEYERHPAKSWYKDGYNLCKRMHENPDDYLLFLSDDRVDATNADAEIGARSLKRKQAVCMDFRGIIGIVAHCESRSVIDTFMTENKTMLGKMSDVFRRKLTLQDKLRVKESLVGIFACTVESDKRILNENQKHLEEEKVRREEIIARKKDAQKEYDDVRSRRIELNGEESKPSEDELLKKDKILFEEHAEFCSSNEIRNLEKKISYDKKHLAEMQKQSARNDEQIEKLKQQIAEQKKNDSEKGEQQDNRQKPLFRDDTPEVVAARQKYEACQEKLSQAVELRKTRMDQYFNTEYCPKSLETEEGSKSSDDAGKEQSVKEMAESWEVLAQAIMELQQAQKELDAARKGYKKRAYRKRGKRHHAPQEAVVAQQT